MTWFLLSLFSPFCLYFMLFSRYVYIRVCVLHKGIIKAMKYLRCEVIRYSWIFLYLFIIILLIFLTCSIYIYKHAYYFLCVYVWKRVVSLLKSLSIWGMIFVNHYKILLVIFLILVYIYICESYSISQCLSCFSNSQEQVHSALSTSLGMQGLKLFNL